MGGSVTWRIGEIKQPRGGYIKPSQFEMYKIDDGYVLSETESIYATFVGTTVDYLTRFVMGSESDAFITFRLGASIAQGMYGQDGSVEEADKLIAGIKDIDDKSIINACKLVTYGVWVGGWANAENISTDNTNPDKETIRNIRIMVQRSMKFWENYGPILKCDFMFKPNGYTETVHSGEGDYLTADTLWDFKVSKRKPTSKHTLQLLMYWIMGQHSGQKIYETIQNLGIFNPRLNEVYLLDINTVPKDVITEVERDVICY